MQLLFGQAGNGQRQATVSAHRCSTVHPGWVQGGSKWLLSVLCQRSAITMLFFCQGRGVGREGGEQSKYGGSKRRRTCMYSSVHPKRGNKNNSFVLTLLESTYKCSCNVKGAKNDKRNMPARQNECTEVPRFSTSRAWEFFALDFCFCFVLFVFLPTFVCFGRSKPYSPTLETCMDFALHVSFPFQEEQSLDVLVKITAFDHIHGARL